MKRTPTTFIFVFLSFLGATGQICKENLAEKGLDGLFKSGGFVSYDSTVFRSYNRPLTAIYTPLLYRLLPDYCFFSTTFASNYYEYADVETALAFPKDRMKITLFLHSPVFTRENKFFMQLFYGLQVDDTAQKVALAREITNIISSITYKGRFKRLINLRDTSVISFELWHNDLSWRIYDFHFDANNKLTDIGIKGGVKRGEMLVDYKRE